MKKTLTLSLIASIGILGSSLTALAAPYDNTHLYIGGAASGDFELAQGDYSVTGCVSSGYTFTIPQDTDCAKNPKPHSCVFYNFHKKMGLLSVWQEAVQAGSIPDGVQNMIKSEIGYQGKSYKNCSGKIQNNCPQSPADKQDNAQLVISCPASAG